ncbi:hypothetical protein LSP04_24960 [Levilactobacillus spicheri]|uniref:Uncharacterized protein n=1 Tax=Levilactobacillus spicheri TaxID=216463 RepID=A0ABQ0WSJ6_9LACO|nr:hypothetical protein [Levilactobacillus spicheri]GEO68077.1 hypothetical protein LSP04_24960 [Levilactobacillus spicheri]
MPTTHRTSAKTYNFYNMHGYYYVHAPKKNSSTKRKPSNFIKLDSDSKTGLHNDDIYIYGFTKPYSQVELASTRTTANEDGRFSLHLRNRLECYTNGNGTITLTSKQPTPSKTFSQKFKFTPTPDGSNGDEDDEPSEQKEPAGSRHSTISYTDNTPAFIELTPQMSKDGLMDTYQFIYGRTNPYATISLGECSTTADRKGKFVLELDQTLNKYSNGTNTITLHSKKPSCSKTFSRTYRFYNNPNVEEQDDEVDF